MVTLNFDFNGHYTNKPRFWVWFQFFLYVCDMVLLIDMIMVINLNGKDAIRTDWLDWLDLA